MNKRVKFTAGVWKEEFGTAISYSQIDGEIIYWDVVPDSNPNLTLAIKPEEIIFIVD